METASSDVDASMMSVLAWLMILRASELKDFPSASEVSFSISCAFFVARALFLLYSTVVFLISFFAFVRISFICSSDVALEISAFAESTILDKVVFNSESVTFLTRLSSFA